jgi:hypothetical protein
MFVKKRTLSECGVAGATPSRNGFSQFFSPPNAFTVKKGQKLPYGSKGVHAMQSKL